MNRIFQAHSISLFKEMLATYTHLFKERDKEIASYRWGIGTEPHTMAETSKQFSVTRQRIGQIENRIINRLLTIHTQK